jgi:hypothetical protein
MANILLVIRAYNDLDCRAPILYKICAITNHKVTVVAFPTNRGFYDFRNFEHINLLIQQGIIFKTFDEFIGIPFPIFTLTVWFFSKLKDVNLPLKITKKIVTLLEKLVFQMLSRFISFLEKRFNILENGFSNFDVIITDEIIFQKGRARAYESLWQMLMKLNKPKIFSIQTGQDPYINVDRLIPKLDSKLKNFSWRSFSQLPLIVPGPNDKEVMSQKITSPIRVMGNTRFDPDWVKMIDGRVTRGPLPNLDNGIKKRPLKLVFFLSKFEYGVKENELFEAINTLSSLCKFIVVIKPHTRGMEMPEIKNKNFLTDGIAYSSTELIHWADVILFTGSSIVFQAMILKKKIIFLKFCQSRLTIFDNSKICCATSLNDLKELLEASDRINVDYEAFLLEHVIPGERFMDQIIDLISPDSPQG